MTDLTLVRVVHLCRELGEILGCVVALCPRPNGQVYQIISMVNPENGKCQSEFKQVLNGYLSIKEVEITLIKYINLSRLRQEARRDISVAGEA